MIVNTIAKVIRIANGGILLSAEQKPGEITPEELEIAHFDKLLRTHLPPTLMAAVCWRAYMDEYMLLSNSCCHMKRQAMETHIDDLINIFYEALDASKSGEEVCLRKPPTSVFLHVFSSCSYSGSITDVI